MRSDDKSQLIQELEKTVSLCKNELQMAKVELERVAKQDLAGFFKNMSEILVDTNNSSVSRTAAGLMLKNHLISKDPAVAQQYQERWNLFPEETREFIKALILSALGTENERPSCAAQCVAYLAVIELTANRWGTLIPKLMEIILTSGINERKREAVLETIGYICQDIGPDVLTNQSNAILTAIVSGMRVEEQSHYVRLAGTTALYNSLEFVKSNFELEADRNYIIKMVCSAINSGDEQVCFVGLQCLVKIASLYYQYLEPYMTQILYPITFEAMSSNHEAISKQGIEFWSTISDEEIDLALKTEKAIEQRRNPMRISKHFSRAALPYLVPLLLTKLTQQEELYNENTWNTTKASSVCLMLLGTCCENLILPYVYPFIKANIEATNWRYREAAVMSFGCIMNGLEFDTLKPLVEEGVPTLVKLMNDPNVNVRDTVSWVLGNICDVIPEVVIKGSYLCSLVECLANCLKAEPRIALNACWAFVGLSDAAYDEASSQSETEKEAPLTYLLSPYFKYIVEYLLDTTDRWDGQHLNLRDAAYEALMDMIKNSPMDCYGVVQQTTVIILDRLNEVQTMDMNITNDSDRSRLFDLQSLLCATLQSVLRKVRESDAPQISDTIMTALMTILSKSASRSSIVQVDAFLAISTLVDLLGFNFVKYMPAFMDYLIAGLTNHEERQVCCCAIGVAGDICRALMHMIGPYSDKIMTVLLKSLTQETLHFSCKPPILSTFGDMAIGIGLDFLKYFNVVMNVLSSASKMEIQASNKCSDIEYISMLREGVLDAYTGILQGLKGSVSSPISDVLHMAPYLREIIAFIDRIGQEREIPDSVINNAAGFIGDLCICFEGRISDILTNSNIMQFLSMGTLSSRTQTRMLCNWAAKHVRMIQTRR